MTVSVSTQQERHQYSRESHLPEPGSSAKPGAEGKRDQGGDEERAEEKPELPRARGRGAPGICG